MTERSTAIIFGANGGIGGALLAVLREEGRYTDVIGFSRADGDFDLTDENTIIAAAQTLATLAPPTLIIVATGLLSDASRGPEKTFKDINAEWMMRNFAVNTIGPALIAKHFLPLLPRDQPSVFAALSARVGSISDNRLGGWYSYRAAKAALNMTIKNMAIELSVTRKRAVCVALHPGTVDTPLSKPFQSNVAPDRLFDAERAALQLLDVIETFKPSDSGKCFAWDGEEIPA